MASLRLVPRPPTRLPVAPLARGLVSLPDGRVDLVEGFTVGALYAQADALGGELVQVSPGAAPGEALRGSAA